MLVLDMLEKLRNYRVGYAASRWCCWLVVLLLTFVQFSLLRDKIR